MALQPPSPRGKAKTAAKRKAGAKAARKAARGAKAPPRKTTPPKPRAPVPPPKAPRRRDYKAEYARRMAGKAKGTPAYKRARGHKELSERQQREASRETRVYNYALNRAALQKDADPDDIAARVFEGIEAYGPAWFQRLERMQASLHRDWLTAGKPKSMIGMAGLAAIGENFGLIGEDDLILLFYH